MWKFENSFRIDYLSIYVTCKCKFRGNALTSNITLRKVKLIKNLSETSAFIIEFMVDAPGHIEIISIGLKCIGPVL